MALHGKAGSEKKIFENNGHIHVYSPGAGTDNPLRSIYFHKQYYSVKIVLCCKFSPLNDFVTVFYIQTCKIGQGQPRVIVYINFVELESPMLYAKFHDHGTFGSGAEDL